MKKNHIKLGLILIGLSLALHAMHYAIFKDLHHLMIFLVADIAFIPLEVFFVSLVLEKLIEKQDEEKVIKKMNMLVGMFYQQMGNSLLKIFVEADPQMKTLKPREGMDFKWQAKDYKKLGKKMDVYTFSLDETQLNFQEIFDRLKTYETTIVTLISNPILLEKEVFSDVLMSVFHLYEELNHHDLETLSKDDKAHLTLDCQRAYKNLSKEWLVYMEHLQLAYPYLFYTAVLDNPYDSRERKEIEKQLIKSR